VADIMRAIFGGGVWPTITHAFLSNPVFWIDPLADRFSSPFCDEM